MVIFNELRITDDRQEIRIECYVDELSIYSSMYISSIRLYYYDNVDHSGFPIDREKVIAVFDNETSDVTIRSVRRCVKTSDIESTLGVSTLDGGLFYVLVECDGTLPAASAAFPCGSDSTIDIGIIPDWQKMYEIGMAHVNAMTSGCVDPCVAPSGFEHFIMLWFALKLAMATMDFDQINEMWKKFLRVSGTHISAGTVARSGGCNCGK